MQQKPEMNCELHNDEAELCESHIIPKFVYKWMKETGPGRFRQLGKFNNPLQDGIKKYMLCKDCEDKFSKYEKWFKEKVFYPYLENNRFVVKNENELKFFVVSVLWRILKILKDDGNSYNFKPNLDKAELEWRNYLLHETSISIYNNFHLFLIDSEYWIDEKSDLYFSRVVDIDIVQNKKKCFVYAKFSSFMLIGEIIGFNENSFKHSNLAIEDEFSSNNQMINEEVIFRFLTERVELIKGFEDLSETQKEKNTIYYKDKLEGLKDSDYMRILNKYK